MNINTLGEGRYASPLGSFVSDALRVPAAIVREPGQTAPDGPLFELAGPRARLYFDPAQTRAGIVTCGGLCPGLNNVIRSAFMQLHHVYGVREVLGFRDGYRGLDARVAEEPLVLTEDFVNNIHRTGGTVLGSSRGPVDTSAALDNLMRRKVDILLTVGGDGTQRGAQALLVEARARNYPLAVVGIPKTIDNDVAWVAHTFGFQSAVEEARKVIDCAHTEAKSGRNGISIVKLMGRNAGFIAAGATVASQDVNFTLIPEVPFRLEGPGGLLAALKDRLLRRRHAVIVVAEGAGQELLAVEASARDASGNPKLADIGHWLRTQIDAYFRQEQIEVTIRYFDPSYLIRSVAADAEDAILCDLYARHAVHAAMAGKTGLIIGQLHDHFIHVPMDMLASEPKRVDPHGDGWRAVLATTGQPARFI